MGALLPSGGGAVDVVVIGDEDEDRIVECPLHNTNPPPIFGWKDQDDSHEMMMMTILHFLLHTPKDVSAAPVFSVWVVRIVSY